jgi:hypothetical protein
MLEEKTPDQINQNISKVAQLFAVRGRWKLIGSNSLRSTQYGVDYDVEDHLSHNPALALQHAYSLAAQNPNIFVIELKCVVDPRLVYDGDYSRHSLETYVKNPLIPAEAGREILNCGDKEEQIELVRDLFILRWTHEDVAEGKIRLIDGSYRTLHDCLMDRTTAKIDLIVKVGDEFAEISENYYIRDGPERNFDKEPTSEDLRKSLENDIHYYAKMDAFKALKRLFSLYRVEGEKRHRAELERLVGFFNGQVGLLNKIRAELSILDTLLCNNFRAVSWEDVWNNLQFIKEQIGQVYAEPITDDLFTQIDRCTVEKAHSTIRTLKDYFTRKINAQSKDFLRTFV